jgi:hypothetical protein
MVYRRSIHTKNYMTPICPVNRMIIQVESHFNDVLRFKSGVQLFIDTKFNPQEKVSLLGRVVSVPLSHRAVPGVDGTGYGTASPGDTVMIRYDVLARTRDQPDRDTPRYRNELNISGEQFWFCYPDQVFAVQRGEGCWEMIGDYVMISPWAEELKDTSLIIRHEHWRTHKPKGVGIALSGAYRGEKVYFRASMAQHYVLEEHDILIIKKRYICGIEKVTEVT